MEVIAYLEKSHCPSAHYGVLNGEIEAVIKTRELARKYIPKTSHVTPS